MVHAGETCLRELTVNVVPCGHCRQFLKEYRDADTIEIDGIANDLQLKLKELLPASFGPADLQV